MLRRAVLAVVLGILCTAPTLAQDRESELRATFPYEKMAAQIPGLTVEDYETAIRMLARMPDLVADVARLPIRPLAVAPSTASQSTGVAPLYNPPPLRPATPPVPRITYPTTRGIYEWEAAHLRRR